MLNKFNVTKLSVGLFVLMLFAAPRLSYADWGIGVSVGGPGYHHDDDRRFYRYHDHPHFGLHMHYLPDGYFTVWAGGTRYYYYDGVYYRYVGYGDYVIVPPPAGAMVTSIPTDFQPVVINGMTYYVNDGIYYVYTRHGYQVVNQPVVEVPPAVTVVAPPAPPAPVPVMQDTFTVNVPNNNGGYSSVVIKKSGNGFVGPQGEFYPEFPKVSQLKVMYGK
jgi:hypothetical protein